MTIKFYRNTSDNIVLNKEITFVSQITATFKNETDIVSPVLLIEDDITDYINVNYVYIEELQRYYYIVGMTSIRNNLFELELHCDVLMSFKETITAQSGLIARQENNFNKYLSDNRIKLNANPYVYQTLFPHGFTGGYTYVMAVLGNSETSEPNNIEDVEVIPNKEEQE